MTPIQAHQSRVDTVAHSGVQPWSQGALFPGVIVRVETYAELHVSPWNVPVLYQELEHRWVRTQWRAIYGADERLFDTYEEAEAWIATRKELDEEPKAYGNAFAQLDRDMTAFECGRQADGVYQGELQNLERAVPVSLLKHPNLSPIRARVAVREYGTELKDGASFEEAVGVAHAKHDKAIAVTFGRDHGSNHGSNTIFISHAEATELTNQLNALRAGVSRG